MLERCILGMIDENTLREGLESDDDSDTNSTSEGNAGETRVRLERTHIVEGSAPTLQDDDIDESVDALRKVEIQE